ncbi:MAG: ATP-grasp fold amidoligase family protein [Lachnospiraceae bacterium]|nr:ATP-grasp fold amidoligase family protein [Lachnospiraceae bacterium]
MSKIRTFIENPQYFITSPAAKGWLNWVPDSLYLKVLYRVIMGRKLNLKNPKEYNEKLQWLKLNDRKPEYSTMVDKYEVRGYIEDLLGDKYLIPCLGIYDSVDDIDIDALPDKFVLKCTHDSGSVEICKDKSSFDIEGARHRLSQAMKRNYYATYREWPYKYVKPRIIAEGYLEGDGGDLKDYKVMCFNGEAKIIEVHENRFVEGKVHTQTFYDREWNIVPLTQVETVTVDRAGERPRQLDEILRLSELIAKNMYHARIDWYIEGDKIYFGEITFFDGSGFESFSTPEMERMLGDMINLPEKWKV